MFRPQDLILAEEGQKEMVKTSKAIAWDTWNDCIADVVECFPMFWNVVAFLRSFDELPFDELP